MITKEILASMTAEQVAQLFTEAKQRRITAAANANAAIKGYEKAVSLRDAKIRELKDDLIKQLSFFGGTPAAVGLKHLATLGVSISLIPSRSYVAFLFSPFGYFRPLSPGSCPS